MPFNFIGMIWEAAQDLVGAYKFTFELRTFSFSLTPVLQEDQVSRAEEWRFLGICLPDSLLLLSKDFMSLLQPALLLIDVFVV